MKFQIVGDTVRFEDKRNDHEYLVTAYDKKSHTCTIFHEKDNYSIRKVPVTLLEEIDDETED